MRKRILYLLFFVAALHVRGEEKFPIYLTEGAEWIEVATRWTDGFIAEEYRFAIKGDTLVNDTAYKRLNCNGDVFALTRHTQDGKVYLRMVASQQHEGCLRWKSYRKDGPEMLWYDFGRADVDAEKAVLGVPVLGRFGEVSYWGVDSIRIRSSFSGRTLYVAYGNWSEIAYGIGDVSDGIVSRMHPLFNTDSSLLFYIQWG